MNFTGIVSPEFQAGLAAQLARLGPARMRVTAASPQQTELNRVVEAEKARVNALCGSIANLCAEAGQPALASDFIKRGLTVAEATRELSKISWKKVTAKIEGRSM